MELEHELTPKPPEVNSVPEKYADGRVKANWDDIKIKLLAEYVAEGIPFGQISRMIGVSRNAAIGKARRLGLHHPNVERQQGWPQRRTETQRQSDRVRSMRHSRYYPPRKPRHIDIAPTPPSDPVGIIELQHHHCRWPCEGSGATMTYCGGTRMIGSPYCGRHAYAASRKSEPTY